MTGNVFAQVGYELEEVHARVNRELRISGGDYLSLVRGDPGALDYSLHPALVILSARLSGIRSRRVLPLACVFQFIHLATRAHLLGYGRMGLPVLLGDFLYSKFFSFLCRYNFLEFLAPLAEVICHVHEGGAMRQVGASLDYPDCLRVIDLESALLVREACRAGARLCGAPPERVEVVSEYGLNLGRAWGLLRQRVPTGAWREFLSRAREKLNFLPVLPEREVFGALAEAVAVMAVDTGGMMAG